MGRLQVGIDVASTTVKAVVGDPHSPEIVWQDYQRHETRQPEMVLDTLVRIGAAFPEVSREELSIELTGSGSSPLCKPVGARFVKEVNVHSRVQMTMFRMHPRAQASTSRPGRR